MAINKEWHSRHKMPENASFKQRAEWHLEHQKNCACRQMPLKLAEEMKRKGLI